MWNKFGVVLLAGFQAGTLIGVIEAIRLLLAVGAGEYDALFWGGVLYGFVGMVGSIVVALPLWTLTPERKFALVMTIVATTLGWWTFSNELWFAGWLMIPWLVSVMLHRTPLRVLISPKGGIVGVGLWVVLLAVFSLTPSRTVYSPPVHQQSATGRPNILWLVVDHLSSASLHHGQTPALDALYKRSVVFENAFTDGITPFQTLASSMAGRPIQTRPPMNSGIDTFPERLAFEGYQTLGVVTDSNLGRFANLHEGFDRFRYLPPRIQHAGLWFGLQNEGTQHLRLVRWLSQLMPSEPRAVSEVLQIFTREFVLLESMEAPWFAMLQLGNTGSNLQDLDRQVGHFLNNLYGDNGPVIILMGNLKGQWQRNVFDPQVPLWIQLQPHSHRVVKNQVTVSALPYTLTQILGVSNHSSWSETNMVRLPPQGPHQPTRFHHQTPHGSIDWVQEGEWRLIRQAGREHLYHISEDPNMEHNVVGHFPEQHQRLMTVFEQE